MRPQGIGLAFRLVLLLLLLVPACKRAERYGGIPKPSPKSPVVPDESKTPERSHQLWREPKELWDIPITFVPATAPEWGQLPEYWNLMPRPVAAVPVASVALSPLALPLLPLSDAVQIKIKVPLGLPDPTPLIPAANRPTFARYSLGKELFFDEILQVEKSDRLFACSTCHQPEHGFAEPAAIAHHLHKNTPSLSNVVYNRRQFWDGRVDFLEQTIVREATVGRGFSPKDHVFTDLSNTLRDSERYRKRFRQVFDVAEPTPDAAAKALATYMRTILSGNSIIDRAEYESARKKAARPTAEHFAAVAEGEIRMLGGTALQLEQGYGLFTGKAGCTVCHPGNGLYTDHDFHNIGLADDLEYLLGKEDGRILHVPIGLKESRLVGAFRTPSLRGLPRTKPYMHDGSKDSLEKVVEHYNTGVKARLNEHLARALRAEPGMARKLGLDDKEVRALVLFLQALDGDPLDPVLTRRPARTKP